MANSNIDMELFIRKTDDLFTLPVKVVGLDILDATTNEKRLIKYGESFV